MSAGPTQQEPQSTRCDDGEPATSNQNLDDESEIREAILADVTDFVEPNPDGNAGQESNVWTCQRRIESHASKNSVEYKNVDVETAINQLVASGKLVRWFGLLAPAANEHLLAIIKNEQMLQTPRKQLIGECNSLRKNEED